MEVDAGQDMNIIDFMSSAAYCLTQPSEYAADDIKSMMHFDPSLHILTSIHLNILSCPYLTYPIIPTG